MPSDFTSLPNILIPRVDYLTHLFGKTLTSVSCAPGPHGGGLTQDVKLQSYRSYCLHHTIIWGLNTALHVPIYSCHSALPPSVVVISNFQHTLQILSLNRCPQLLYREKTNQASISCWAAHENPSALCPQLRVSF